jgi:hypothetical protein
MAELLGTGSGAPMIVDTRSGDDGGMFGSNPLLLLIALGLFAGGRGGGLFGGGHDGAGEASVGLINAQTAASVAESQIQSLQSMQTTLASQNLTNQLNNIQADQANQNLSFSQQLNQQQANNDVKLLLSRIIDGDAELSEQFAQCCCDNKILGLQNTAQIVGAVTGEGQATRALINQLDKENLLSQLNDAKNQISNLNQTIAITGAIDAKLDQIFPPHFRCNCDDRAA